ncbi:hypothetical protein SGUI_0688 [Serinicoccus hydrothermalis]|uniref:Uncharacterized protein n=1 Tax=Serinicoccus hydrothermalis TaxID=1758689 RepID=A0A1B1N9J6_9MICO|nr:hypothetical protein [Serinicoccus hydrothermalis]ANS78084.1 hypothetical protein SGUI_0688 [Serinicoccus hydrothermalis]
MSVEVRDGGLLVDTATWAGWADGGEVPQEARELIEQVPGGEQGLDAARAPLVVVQIQTATPGGVFTHEAWVGAEAVAVLVDLEGTDRRRVVVLPPDHLGAALARVVGIAPRAHAQADREPREVSAEALEAWFDPQASAEERAAADLGADRSWRLVAAAVGSTQAPLMLAALDGRTSGVWVVEASEEALRLVPTTPTQVWRGLTGLLPSLVPQADPGGPGDTPPDAEA